MPEESSVRSIPGSPVVIAGLPRAGTTWVAKVLHEGAGGVLIQEPDNEKLSIAALVAKRGLARFPVLVPDSPADNYAALWCSALAGIDPATATARMRAAGKLYATTSADEREGAVHNGRNGRPSYRIATARQIAGARLRANADDGSRPSDAARGAVIVKSVHAPLALDWLPSCAPAAKFAIVVRHPANVLASWLGMHLPDRDRALDQVDDVVERWIRPWSLPGAGTEPVRRAAWQVCLLTSVLLDAAERHPTWLLLEHDALCRSPHDAFPRAATALGLRWRAEGARFLSETDQHGDGFTVNRKTADQPDRWRTRLAEEALTALRDLAGAFPHLNRWASDLSGPPHI